MFPENLVIIEQTVDHDSVPDDSCENGDAEAELTPTFSDRMKNILFPDVAVVDVEHILTGRTRFVCLHNIT
jgi:hypothetical protein